MNVHDKASATCLHNRVEIRRRALRGGIVQLGNQCLDCGRAVGNWLRRSTVSEPDGVPAWDAALQTRHLMGEHRSEHTVQPVGPSFSDLYHEHLSSDAWAELRERIIDRDGGLCQGCLQAEAVHVHHLTYHNLGDEFCWQLVAVCRACHERIHGRSL